MPRTGRLRCANHGVLISAIMPTRHCVQMHQHYSAIQTNKTDLQHDKPPLMQMYLKTYMYFEKVVEK